MEHPYIVDDGVYKTLHFDDRSVQSCMRLSSPHALAFGYTRTMTAFRLFRPEPRNILIVGLGGGSLSKYCFHTFPESTVTTVEISAAVIELRDEFAIPPDGPRFHTVHANAAVYMRQQTATADVILLDGFDPAGMSRDLTTQRFYDDCYQALRPNGILVSNVWGSDRQVRCCRARIGHSFRQQTTEALSATGGNLLIFGLKRTRPVDWRSLRALARRLDRETGRAYSGILDRLHANAAAALRQSGAPAK